MKKIIYTNVSLKQMLDDFVKQTLQDDSASGNKYYWLNSDEQFVEIEEVDILTDRFRTEDGDFSYYDSELKNSRIYIKEEH